MNTVDAANWMKSEIEKKGFLYQEEAVMKFMPLEDLTILYFDISDNACIGRLVLKEFNKLTPNVVYDRIEKLWRKRQSTDQPGRQQ